MRVIKDSGIEWIGEIPCKWTICKHKYILQLCYSGGTPKSTNDNFYADEGICFVTISDMTKTEFISKTIRHLTQHGINDKKLKILSEGTILYSIYATLGAVSELNTNATISQAILALKPKNEIEKRYYKYYLKNLSIYVNSVANGNTQFNLNAEKIRNFDFLVPPQNEQEKIASYLDDKTKLVDKTIELTKEQIDKLKEYKQALITETVTKGLDKNVKMKDSGVEWRGEIPEHWKYVKLGTLFIQVKNKNRGNIESNVLSLSYGKIKQRNVDNNMGLLPESFETYNIIKKDDIVLRLTDLQNDQRSLRCGICKEKGIITSAYITLRKSVEISPKYYYLLLHSFDIQKGFYGMGAGVRQSLKYSGELSNLSLLCPTYEEQSEIARYLEVKTVKIENIISQKENLIKKLEEYKKSLIYECVTGKKEII